MEVEIPRGVALNPQSTMSTKCICQLQKSCQSYRYTLGVFPFSFGDLALVL